MRSLVGGIVHSSTGRRSARQQIIGSQFFDLAIKALDAKQVDFTLLYQFTKTKNRAKRALSGHSDITAAGDRSDLELFYETIAISLAFLQGYHGD